jgi:hypothetical protein
MALSYREALAGLDAVYTSVTEWSAGLTPHDLLEPSRCRGWVVADVLFHLLCDAQRALVALATPVPGPPDRDYVSYWRGFAAQAGDPIPAALWVRRSAAAFRDGTGIAVMWGETAPAAVRAAGRADPGGCVATQGHALGVPDFLATLATEAVIHLLDMTVHIGPPGAAVEIAVSTLDGLLQASRPAGWGAAEYLLKGTGRVPLSEQDITILDADAAKFPLLS